MAERIMEIIIYVISSLRDTRILSDANIRELENLGYTTSEISTAFSWLAEKVETVSIPENGPDYFKTKGFRILHSMEKDLFTPECYGELIQYSSLGLIDNEQLELLIERALMSGFHIIDSRLLKNYIAALHFDHSDIGKMPGRIMLEGNDTIN